MLDKRCPACDSTFISFVLNVVGRRTQQVFPQYHCMDCRTFFHRSGYKETDDQRRIDYEYLQTQRDNHISIMSQLCLEIVTRAPHVKSALEVGYGLGFFMQACRNFGLTNTYGFEVNPHCHEHAAGALGLNCALGLFNESHDSSYDLIASIMVFEHLEDPRGLFRTMVSKLNPDGIIYLSVPFFERRDWPFLRSAGTTPGSLPDLMHDNDVHINHFSINGLERLGKSLGARSAEYFVSSDTFYRSPGAYPGMLFRF